jgi:hypothetical protein
MSTCIIACFFSIVPCARCRFFVICNSSTTPSFTSPTAGGVDSIATWRTPSSTPNPKVVQRVHREDARWYAIVARIRDKLIFIRIRHVDPSTPPLVSHCPFPPPPRAFFVRRPHGRLCEPAAAVTWLRVDEVRRAMRLMATETDFLTVDTTSVDQPTPHSKRRHETKRKQKMGDQTGADQPKQRSDEPHAEEAGSGVVSGATNGRSVGRTSPGPPLRAECAEQSPPFLSRPAGPTGARSGLFPHSGYRPLSCHRCYSRTFNVGSSDDANELQTMKLEADHYLEMM